jgi:hypothetical protein
MKCWVDGRFPLYASGGDQHRFDYAVFLLNKDIEQVGPSSDELMVVDEFAGIARHGFAIDIGESQVSDIVSDSNDFGDVTTTPSQSETNRGYSCEKGASSI